MPYVHLRYDTSISRYCHALERRRGKKIAVVAAARKLLKCIYVMLKEDRTFRLEGGLRASKLACIVGCLSRLGLGMVEATVLLGSV